MKQFLCVLWCLLFFSVVNAQERNTLYQTKKITVDSLTTVVYIDTVALNKNYFQITNNQGTAIDTAHFSIDFNKASITFKKPIHDTLTVSYLNYPDFLTKTYALYDTKRVIPNKEGAYVFSVPEKQANTFTPFEGLNTNGSISRGITVGNNQNLVTNSNLDLQIVGNLSDKVQIRASLQDSNVPLQNGGYSQKMDEFDQIFMELFSTNWSIKAGDLFLENRASRFLNFNKKVQGISGTLKFENDKSKTTIETAAALVRGQYAKSEFIGQEGNQGPYKLKGSNNQLYILIISGSESVFVNGRKLTRGEQNDYVIDYNSGEIRFTTLFPITAEMRIVVEYQFTDRNYARFLGYGGIKHERKNWNIAGYVYNETDIKNQPVQQNLNKEQVDILKQAGDSLALMMAPSAYPDTYSENKTLYKKVNQNGYEFYQYSNTPTDTLYAVSFSYVGPSNGNYRLASSASIGKIYEFIEPIDGVQQGDYEPLIQLIAPMRLTLATVMGQYKPKDFSQVDFEFGFSNHDQNLFSPIDNEDNKGIAANVNATHRVLNNKWKIDVFGNVQLVTEHFKTIERLYSIEFDRDWNVSNTFGNQSLLTFGSKISPNENSALTYQYSRLEYSNSYIGHKQSLMGTYQYKNFQFNTNTSFLAAKGSVYNTNFARSKTQAVYTKNKNWAGSRLDLENYQVKDVATQQFQTLSQKYAQMDAFVGRGDTLKTYVEIGYKFRVNDSLQNNVLRNVSNAHSFYVKSQLFKTQTSDLSVYANYRRLKYTDTGLVEPTLNSRITYNDRYLKNLIQTNTIYETSSGAVAQQEFTYIKVDPGLGTHMWNDYNGNGIQELEEFEIAPYPDLAEYVRMFLPNQTFVKTHQTKLTQVFNFNFSTWQNESGFKKFASQFHLQSSFIIDRSILRDGNGIAWNPFGSSSDDLVAENANIRNSIYFNRGKQKYTTIYSLINNRAKNLMNFGSLDNKITTHQVQFQHLLNKWWLAQLTTKLDRVESISENYGSKNYLLHNSTLNPKISYLFSQNARVELFYEWKDKENVQGDLETLEQHRIGTAFNWSTSQKFTLNGEFSFYNNKFSGNPLSAVAYQMLEGLQPGKNITWRLLFQRNLTKYLDANISYQGRTSETAKTIHTGSIQLRAFF
ncbi:hypothetical protein [Paenimyroides aestuarii]|uniref:Uncharacterized protein n=1 Tax=Paenimyroides aestuarii TaxID=2968490 RepID=A0ABY5NUC2_9FLAO|nr:hypothetical protein [Paenimyroides aestuarii]UUV22113.1 hypothetical protein NPX36_03450 [Paenimyroides aestuarii]